MKTSIPILCGCALIFLLGCIAGHSQSSGWTETSLHKIGSFVGPVNGNPETNVYVFDYKGCHVFVASNGPDAVAISSGSCN